MQLQSISPFSNSGFSSLLPQQPSPHLLFQLRHPNRGFWVPFDPLQTSAVDSWRSEDGYDHDALVPLPLELALTPTGARRPSPNSAAHELFPIQARRWRRLGKVEMRGLPNLGAYEINHMDLVGSDAVLILEKADGVELVLTTTM